MNQCQMVKMQKPNNLLLWKLQQIENNKKALMCNVHSTKFMNAEEFESSICVHAHRA